MHKEAEIRDPLILGNKSYHDITRDIASLLRERQINIGGYYFLYHLSFIWGMDLYGLHNWNWYWSLGLE